MEFKKCARCGCFFVSNNSICCNCAPKDNLEIAKLNNYIEEYGNTNYSLEDISINTGISVRNLNRYISDNNLNININLQ